MEELLTKAIECLTTTALNNIISFFTETLEVEEWGVEGEEMEEGEEEEEEEESVGGEDGGDGNLQEFSDSLQVDEDSTDVSRETSSYTQVC